MWLVATRMQPLSVRWQPLAPSRWNAARPPRQCLPRIPFCAREGSDGPAPEAPSLARGTSLAGQELVSTAFSTLYGTTFEYKQGAKKLPQVDWSRYHLSVLFVDRSDTIRARIGRAVFESIAEWNGFGRILLHSTAGTDATGPGLATAAALMSRAVELGLPPKYFVSTGVQLEPRDLDLNDLVLVFDSASRDAILQQVSEPKLGVSEGLGGRAAARAALSTAAWRSNSQPRREAWPGSVVAWGHS